MDKKVTETKRLAMDINGGTSSTGVPHARGGLVGIGEQSNVWILSTGLALLWLLVSCSRKNG
jgi:hypothetical protein